MASLNIPISSVTHRITIKVTGLKGYAVRLVIARYLFILGAWVAQVTIRIED